MPPRREPRPRPASIPALPAEAALSFLKDTKGTLSWSTSDLAKTLDIDRPEAQQALAFLQAQGYVQLADRATANPSGGQWTTTPAGETVSGAKPPRFSRESVEQALAALRERIKQNNKGAQAPFLIKEAVAFGDFLIPDRVRVQAADVGIRLNRREASPRREKDAASEPRSASDARAEHRFLRDLRAKSALLNLRPYADWMSRRSHRTLL